jgi:threonine dehydratase
MIDRGEIEAAHELIRGHVRRTPLLALDGGDFGLDVEALVLKLELLQHAGSFKARGAFTNLLMRDVPEAGVVAASGGNHGVAVAFAARKLGKPAKIFVPVVSSPSKIERIRSYGAELVVGGERYADALAASEAWAAESGALTIHAYDRRETLLGQGTLGLEMQEQAPEIDSLLVAVGGGGSSANRRWYGASQDVGRAEEAPTSRPSPRKARRRPAGSPDSLAPKRVGELMFPIARLVSEVVLVSDEEIVEAQRALWEGVRVAAEPGGAAAFAALLAGKYVPAPGERVGVVVCGGNTDAVDMGRKR